MIKNSNGSVLIWTVVLAILIELVVFGAVSMISGTRGRQASEARRIDARDFASAVEAVLADKNQCATIVVPIVNKDASTVAAGAFAAGANVVAWAKPTAPAAQIGGVLLQKLGPASKVAGEPKFIVDQAGLARQAAGLLSVQTWKNASGAATAPSLKNDLATRKTDPDGSISNFAPEPLSLAPSGLYLRDLALIEISPSYDDTPGFPRAFEIWASFDRASDAPLGVVPAAIRLAQIAALTVDYTKTGAVAGCILRPMARVTATANANPYPNPFALSCPAKSVLTNATVTINGAPTKSAVCVTPQSSPVSCGNLPLTGMTATTGFDANGNLTTTLTPNCAATAPTGGPPYDPRVSYPPDNTCNKVPLWSGIGFSKLDDTGTHPPTAAEVRAAMGFDPCAAQFPYPRPAYLWEPLSGCQYVLDYDGLAGPGGHWNCMSAWCCQ